MILPVMIMPGFVVYAIIFGLMWAWGWLCGYVSASKRSITRNRLSDWCRKTAEDYRRHHDSESDSVMKTYYLGWKHAISHFAWVFGIQGETL